MRHFVVSIIMAMSVAACGPKAEHSPPASDGFSDFGPTTDDAVITLKNDATFEKLFSSVLADQSADVFRFSDEVFNYSFRHSDTVALKKFAHELLNLFYSNPLTTTHFGAENSAYLEAAMAFEGENILKYIKSLSSDDAVRGIEIAVARESIPWPARISLEPKVFIVSIKSYLQALPARMRENNVASQVVELFISAVNRDFLPSLTRAETQLANVGPKTPLKTNVVAIKNAVSSLNILPEALRKDIRAQLDEADEMQKLISRPASTISKAEDMVQVVSRIWIRLSPDDRIKYIRSINQKLYEVLSGATKQELQYYAGLAKVCNGNNKPCFPPTTRDQLYRQGLEKGFQNSCFPRITQALSEWLLTYNEYGRKQAFRNKYPDVYKLFTEPLDGKTLTDEDLENFVGHFDSFVFMRDDRSKAFEMRAQNLCVSRIASTVDQSINDYLLRSLDRIIRDQERNLQQVVLKSVTQNLVALRESVGKIASFEDYFKQIGVPELKKTIFSDIESLPAIERKDIKLILNGPNNLDIVATSGPVFLTGAEVLGTSLSANAKRFEGLVNIEGKNSKSPQHWRVIFSQINKMLAMLGFRKMDNTMFPSLHRSMSGSLSELDVYKYDCSPSLLAKQEQKKTINKINPTADNTVTRFEDCTGHTQYANSYFAIPDTIGIQNGFTPVDTESPRASVSGQAEILRGTSAMLSYFNDWKGQSDEYDEGMGTLDYRGFKLLPRQAFVNLSFGIMSVPLRNLKREFTYVHMFDQWGREIRDWMTNGDPSAIRISTALSDLTVNGPTRIIKSIDLARFIIAVDDFAKSIEGIEKTKASVINPPGKTERQNLEALQAGKKQLLQMMVGLSNFLTSKFQDRDGGFWHTYSMDRGEIIEKNLPRTLRDQALIQDALLRTFARWGGNGAKWSAIDSVHFSNKRLWNNDRGFYQASETGNSVLDPYVFVLTLRNLKNLIPMMKSEVSRNQASEILKIWDKKFLEWIRSSQT